MDVKLSNGFLTAVLNSHGAVLKSLKDSDGNEYVWDGDLSRWNRSIPFLVPMVGSLPDSAVRIQGEAYHMKQQGFCREMEWTVAYQTPFSAIFTLALEYALVARTLKMELLINNTSCFATEIGFPRRPAPKNVNR